MTNRATMSDRQLDAALHGLNRPLAPDSAFAEGLYRLLERERRHKRRGRLYLLAAVALLVMALGSAAVIGVGGLRPDKRPVIAPLVPPSLPATLEPTLSPTAIATEPRQEPRPPTAFARKEVMELAGLADLTTTADAVWLWRSSGGQSATWLHLDAADDQGASVFDMEENATPIVVVGNRVWYAHYVPSEEAWRLVSDDPEPYGATTSSLPIEPFELGVDESGQLWITHSHGTSLISPDGSIVRTIEHPWGSRDEDNWYNSVAPAPMFGSLWAHEASIPAVHRVDPETGDVTATIQLTGCAPNRSTHFGHHPALIYALRGINGTRDSIVASCSMDATHTYPGPMTVIDPQTNTVITTIDVGGEYGQAAVLAGGWYVPATEGSGPDETARMRLLLVDPATGQQREVADLGSVRASSSGSPPARVVVTGDSLWFLLRSAGRDTTTLIRLDPAEDD